MRLKTNLLLALVASTYAQELGQWGPLIKLPIVPMAAAVVPQTSQLLLWAAAKSDMWTLQDNSAKYTLFSSIDLTTMQVTARNVSNTGHDMFCPGITFDAKGQLIVSGGSTATPVSSYDYTSGQWSRLADMNVPRGYHSTVITSERRTFAIGGSWSGGFGGKVGELYDSDQNVWVTLPGCPADPIYTNDREGVYRSDNHANLFTWKDAAVFHAGPSKAMHWFDTRGAGRIVNAGNRADGPDAMCGVAVMYDTGKIIFAGGSPDYSPSQATNAAYLITLGDAYGSVSTEKVAPLNFARALANSVVLPDGQVLVTGGQSYAEIFTDNNPVLTPELYNPETKTWRKLRNEPTPRTYHSVSILLPDATIFSGGGGACGNCQYNHLDGAIFKPPYLYKNGALAARPTIQSTSADTAALGQTITVTTTASNVKFAFVRMGSATHSVNTDQRRFTLMPTSRNGNNYVLTIPSDPGLIPVGWWYLFVLSDGVPSVAKMIRLTSSAAVTPLQSNLPDPNKPCAGNTAPSSMFKTANGEIFGICLDTNMNNFKDLSEKGGINSIEECSTLCSNTAECTMTTYLPGSKTCYMKYGKLTSTAAGSGWPSSIKLWARPCPANAATSNITTTENGQIYGICSNTDFNGQDAYVDNNVASVADCARRCATRSDCTAATWMISSKTCYMKKTIRPSASNTGFHSIFRMQRSPCLNSAAPSSIYTANNGDIYGICAGQDFYGSDLSNIAAADTRACSQACSTTSGCVAATYITADKGCYLKSGRPSAVSWTGRDATFRIGIAL